MPRKLILAALTTILLAVLPMPAAQAVPYGWTGYDWYTSPEAVAWGNITIPWFNCNGLAGDRLVIPWIGVQTGNKLQQAGMTLFCDEQTKWISAWYENYPEPPIPVTEFVEPRIGDTIRIRVEVFPHHTDYLIRNLTSGKEWSDSFRIDRNTNDSDRIWTAEQYGGSAGIPNFGQIVFEKPNGYPCDLCFMAWSEDFGELSAFYAGRTKFNVSDGR